MKKSNSLSRIKRRQQEKVLRFSIRKYSFGAASVAVAALMFLGARVVSADSVTPVDQPHVEALTQDTSPLASQDKEEPTSSVKVDTAVASQLVTQLKDQLHVKEAANTDLLVAAKEELAKAELTLADSKVSQEEVDALVARLTNVLDQLRAVETPQVKEEEKNDRSAQDVTPEIKPEVAKPTPEISAKSEETSENTNAEQLEKAKASLKVSIDRLEQAIAQTPENDLTREILEKANAQVAVAKSAFGGVEVSLRDVEDMNRVIKRNESSVMIARNRLTSGHNDVRNGAAIPVGTTLRADAGATYDNAVGLYFTKEGDGSGYPAGTMLFRDRNQNTADNQKVSDVKNVVKVDVTKNGDTYDWVIEFDRDPENHKNAHAWFTIPNGHTLVDDGSASFSSYWGGSGGKRRIDTQGRLPRNLQQIFEQQVAATTKVTNYGTPGGAIEWALGKATKDGFWSGADGVVKTLEEIISKPDSLYFNRTGGARTSTEKDVLVSDYLKDWLIQHTQRVYHFEIDYRGKTKDSTSNYIFRFKTKAAEGTPLMYAAGMRSYEFNTHRNDMQWYGLPSPKVTGADQTIEKGKEIRLEFTTKDNLAGFSLGDPKLGYNTADSIKLVGNELKLDNQKVEVQKVSDYEHKLIITGRVASEPSDTGYQVKVKSVNNVGQSAEFTSTVKVTKSTEPSDTIAPTITAEDATVTKNEPITPIPVTAVDNTGGVGMRDNNPIEVSNLPQGLKYENGQITGTTNAKTGYYTVKITAYDKNNNHSTKSIRITVKEQADKYNPTGDSLTVNQGQEITDEAVKAKVTNYGPGTLTVESKPTSTATAGDAGNAVVKVTYPDGSSDTVNVPVTVKDVTGPTITAESATVTKNEPITPIPVTAVDNTGGVGMRDNNPIQVSNLPQGLKYENGQITGTTNAKTGYYTVKITAYDKNNTASTKSIRITVQDQTDKYNPTGETLTVPYNHNITDDEVKAKVQNFGPGTLTVESKPSTKTSGNVGNAVVKVTYPDGSSDTVNVPVVVGRPNKDDYTPKYDDGSGKPGTSVEIPVSEANGKKIPDGTTYTSGTPGITVDKDGKVTVTIPADKTPGEEVTGKILVRYPDGSEEEVPVKVTVTSPATPTTETPSEIEITRKPNGDAIVTPKKPDGSTYPPGTKVEIPSKDKDGNPTTITVTIGDNGSGEVPNDNLPKNEVPGTGTVTEPNKKPSQPVDVTTPAQKTPTVDVEQDPKTGDVTVTPKQPDGSTYPPGTKVEISGEDGKGKVANSDLPDVEKPGIGKTTEPGKPSVEVPNVTTPPKVTIFENGLLPDSIELPELMIEVRWIGEDGNVLKPSLKTGSEKDAEHGSISGYEFVRTVIDENEPVMTHIFRKVSSNTTPIPVTPDTNGNSSHDTPALTTPTPVTPVIPDANGNSGQDTAVSPTPIPDAVTPNENHEDATDSIDNRAKSNNSQNVLPNTGTESNATLASLGLLGMLGGLRFLIGKKKED